jgi:hypothetical protein
MPFDQAVAISLITALSVLAFIGARHSSGQGSTRPVAFALALLLALLYAWACSGKLAWASILPVGCVLFWSNLMPALLSLAAGLASKAAGLAGWHRPATTTALLVLAVAYIVTPLARPWLAPVQLAEQSKWHGDLCLQTHAASCAPAAAATLLRLAGIDSDERALASACSTSRHGTEPLGLYSGLAVASYRYGVHPRVASPNADDWITSDQLPCIALVYFADTPSNGSMRRLLGPQGEGHAIVVLDRDAAGTWIIADPAFGKTSWTDQVFRERFTGDAIYLDSK